MFVLIEKSMTLAAVTFSTWDGPPLISIIPLPEKARVFPMGAHILVLWFLNRFAFLRHFTLPYHGLIAELTALPTARPIAPAKATVAAAEPEANPALGPADF